MTQKLVEMHDMFGSLYQPIPIFDIPCAAMNRIVHEAVLPPVMLGGLSSLLLLYLVIFWESGVGIILSNIQQYTETQNNQQTKIMSEDYYFPVSCDRQRIRDVLVLVLAFILCNYNSLLIRWQPCLLLLSLLFVLAFACKVNTLRQRTICISTYRIVHSSRSAHCKSSYIADKYLHIFFYLLNQMINYQSFFSSICRLTVKKIGMTE